MYVENGLLSLDPIYLLLLHSNKFSDNFSDMDVRAQGVLRYHLIKVPCIYLYSLHLIPEAGVTFTEMVPYNSKYTIKQMKA